MWNNRVKVRTVRKRCGSTQPHIGFFILSATTFTMTGNTCQVTGRYATGRINSGFRLGFLIGFIRITMVCIGFVHVRIGLKKIGLNSIRTCTNPMQTIVIRTNPIRNPSSDKSVADQDYAFCYHVIKWGCCFIQSQTEEEIVQVKAEIKQVVVVKITILKAKLS